MPKPKGHGGKNRRKAKNITEDHQRELILKEQGQEYAHVLKFLGEGRCELHCYDGVKRIGLIRGKMNKTVWIKTGDTLLVTLREFLKDSKKCDIVHRYKSHEVKLLKVKKEIPYDIDPANEEPYFEYFVFEGRQKDECEETKVDKNQPRRALPKCSDSEDESGAGEDDDKENQCRIYNVRK